MRCYVRRIITSFLFSFFVFANGAPAHAATADDQKLCENVLEVFVIGSKALSATKQSLRYVDAGVKRYIDALEFEIEMDEIASDLDKTAEEIGKFSGEAGEITEPVQNVSKIFETLKRVLHTSRESAFKPVHATLDRIVTDTDAREQEKKLRDIQMRLEKMRKDVKAFDDVWNGVSKSVAFTCATTGAIPWSRVVKAYPASPNFNMMEATNTKSGGFPLRVWLPSNNMIIKASTSTRPHLKPGSEAQCKKDITAGLNSLSVSISPVASDLKGVATALEDIDHALKDVIEIFKPIELLDKPLKDMRHAMEKVHHALVKFKHLLKHRFKIKIHGLTVLNTSVHHVLKEWNHIVKKVEHELHISYIKHLMNHEMDEIMKPVTKAISREIHSLERSVKIDGFNMDDAKKAFSSMEKDFEKVLGVDKAMTDAKKLAAEFDAVKSRCIVN